MNDFPTALEVAALIRSKQASPLEVLEETLNRVDKRNPTLNAVIWRDDDAARATAAAMQVTEDSPPFLGVPIPIKDLTSAAGQPLTYGSFGASDAPRDEDERIVAAFRKAGFVLAGRTNTPEMGPITAAENRRYGISRNPWNTDHTPGGSSGGAASAVASGMYSVAHANDGGGSIRIPASCCGLVGLKVSRGRVPAVVESWEGASVEGVVTHTVADTAAVLDVIAGPDLQSWYNAPPPARPFREEVGADPGRLRVGLVEAAPLGMPIDPACLDAVRAVATTLDGLGHHVEPWSLDFDLEALLAFVAAIDGSYIQDIEDWSKVEEHNRLGHERGLALPAVDYLRHIATLQRWTRPFVAAWGRDFDVLLSPTMTVEPPPAGQVLGEVQADPVNTAPTVLAMAIMTSPFNVSGLPAISLPLHQSERGLPVGVQLVGGPFDEATVLRVASQLEAATPWAARHPAL